MKDVQIKVPFPWRPRIFYCYFMWNDITNGNNSFQEVGNDLNAHLHTRSYHPLGLIGSYVSIMESCPKKWQSHTNWRKMSVLDSESPNCLGNTALQENHNLSIRWRYVIYWVWCWVLLLFYLFIKHIRLIQSIAGVCGACIQWDFYGAWGFAFTPVTCDSQCKCLWTLATNGQVIIGNEKLAWASQTTVMNPGDLQGELTTFLEEWVEGRALVSNQGNSCCIPKFPPKTPP